jgi:hypothetical protein
MGRSLGLVTIVIGLVGSAILLVAQLTSTGASGPVGGKLDQNAPVAHANREAATVAAFEADRELQAYQIDHGTFAGAVVGDVSGVSVRRADTASYCLQVVTNGVALYEAGPGGSLSPQPCG